MEFDKEKFKNVLHYIMHKSGFKRNGEKIILFSLLYFSDFNYFEIHEESLTGESYMKLSGGSVPIHFDLAISELLNGEKIGGLTKEELSVIDDFILQLKGMSVSQIGECSCGDMSLRATDEGEIIDYSFVFYCNPEYVKRKYD